MLSVLLSALGVAAVPAAAPAATQQIVTLKAGAAVAKWEKKDWRRTRAVCMSRPFNTYYWRTVIKNGECGTSVKTAPLEAGVTYDVEVSGRISHWDSSDWPSRKTCGGPQRTTDPFTGESYLASADAQWTFATKRNAARCGRIRTPIVGAGFRVNTERNADPAGWRYPWIGMDRVYERVDHTYTFKVAGRGRAIWFSIYDHKVTDNLGAFTIKLTPAPAV